MLCDSCWIRAVALFHSKKSTVYNVSKRENDCFHSNRLVPILPCDENTTFKKRGNHQELTTLYFIDFNAEKKANGSFQQTTFQFKPTGNTWNT
jgi:hypothetical protein